MGFEHVAVGGTFDCFHKGHEALIEKAVELGLFVTIGVTTPDLAGKDAEPYNVRKEAVEQCLTDVGCDDYTIVGLEDPFGPAAYDESMDAIVVSDETYERALELNNIRDKSGLKMLEIIKMPMILAEDGTALSSTRIRAGKITRDGRVL